MSTSTDAQTCVDGDGKHIHASAKLGSYCTLSASRRYLSMQRLASWLVTHDPPKKQRHGNIAGVLYYLSINGNAKNSGKGRIHTMHVSSRSYGVTEPPYWILIDSAISVSYNFSIQPLHRKNKLNWCNPFPKKHFQRDKGTECYAERAPKAENSKCASLFVFSSVQNFFWKILEKRRVLSFFVVPFSEFSWGLEGTWQKHARPVRYPHHKQVQCRWPTRVHKLWWPAWVKMRVSHGHNSGTTWKNRNGTRMGTHFFRTWLKYWQQNLWSSYVSWLSPASSGPWKCPWVPLKAASRKPWCWGRSRILTWSLQCKAMVSNHQQVLCASAYWWGHPRHRTLNGARCDQSAPKPNKDKYVLLELSQ